MLDSPPPTPIRGINSLTKLVDTQKETICKFEARVETLEAQLLVLSQKIIDLIES